MRAVIHIKGVLTQNTSSTQTTSRPEYQGLLERVVNDACRELELHPSYAQRALSCDFPKERITPFSVVNVYQETDRIIELCDEARRRLAVVEWSGATKHFGEELRKELTTRVDLCRENLERGLRDVVDPRAILTMFHLNSEIRATILHMNLLLGIVPEPCGGDISRHMPEELNRFREGGWMYQASDLHLIKSVFSTLKIRSGASFFDLGSGYGHPVIYGANLRADVSFTGVEIMSSRVKECNEVARRLHLSNARFEAADAACIDLFKADVVFLFNPFPSSVRHEVMSRLIDVAEVKPIVVVDYDGLVTREAFAFRRMDKKQIIPFHIYGSRKHFEGSLAIAGLAS